MKTRARYASAIVYALLLAPLAAPAAAPSVGVDIAVQLWDPMRPDADTPRTLYGAPAGISGPMNDAWNKARQAMMDTVPKALAELDVGGGFRLYDVHFNVNELGPISLAQISPIAQGEAAPLRLHWTIPATHMALKVRTPGAAPQGTDPGFSATVDLDLAVAITLSDTPGKTLQVTEVRIAVPKNGVHFQGDNPTGDLLVGLTSLLSEVATGKNLNTLLNVILDDQNFANGHQNALAQFSPDLRRIDLAKLANDALAPANQAVRVPTAYVRIGQWLDRTGQGQMLSVVFAPRNLPLPRQNGALSGWVNFSAASASSLPAACVPEMFSTVDATVQTGPRPVLGASPWRFGEAPLLPVGSAALTTGALDARNRRCSFHLSGLVSTWPNRIEFHKRTAQAPSHYVANPKQYWALSPQGWSSPAVPTTIEGVLPHQVGAAATSRDLLAALDTVSSTVVGAQRRPGAVRVEPSNPGDPAGVWNAKVQSDKTQAAQPLENGKKAVWGSTGARAAP
jgi:hypothetical protein